MTDFLPCSFGGASDSRRARAAGIRIMEVGE